MKCCKVYCTYFGTRRGPSGGSCGPTKADGVLQLFKEIINNDLHIDHGVDSLDIIIINNNNPDCYPSYLNEINNTQFKNGTIKVINRENIGASIGAFSHCYELFHNQYDYFLFCEDDIYFFENGYYNICIEHAEANDIDFLGINTQWENPIYIAGGFGLCKNKSLFELKKINGSLQWDQSGKGYGKIGLGEIVFTQQFLDNGFKVQQFDTDDYMCFAENWKEFSPQVKYKKVYYNYNINRKALYRIGKTK